MLSRAAWEKVGRPFPSTGDFREHLRPLELTEQLHTTDPVTHVVVSVGGNDVREILMSMHRLSEIVKTFHENYRGICARLRAIGGEGGEGGGGGKDEGKDGGGKDAGKDAGEEGGVSHGPKIILMLQYQPCLTHDASGYGVYSAMEMLPGPGTGQQKLHAVMQRIYAPVLTMAKE